MIQLSTVELIMLLVSIVGTGIGATVFLLTQIKGNGSKIDQVGVRFEERHEAMTDKVDLNTAGVKTNKDMITELRVSAASGMRSTGEFIGKPPV